MYGTWIAVVAGVIALTLAFNGWVLARTRMNPDHGARLAFFSALTALLALPICLASFGVYAVGLFKDLPNPSGITFLTSAAVVILFHHHGRSQIPAQFPFLSNRRSCSKPTSVG